MSSNTSHSKPIRLFTREADHACAADDADAASKQYCTEELGLSPLHSAAFTGSLKNVKKLLNERMDVNIKDKQGWTPLHDAAIQGHTQIVKLLLSAGADPNIQDLEDFYTPLHDAVRMNHPDIIELLLQAGADQSLKDKWHQTASDIAQKYQLQNIIKLFDSFTKSNSK